MSEGPLGWIEIYIVAIVHLTLLPVNLFPIHYSHSPWRSSNVGKALMLNGTALAALYDLGVLGFWWKFGGYNYFYAAVITLVASAISFQYFVMRRLQKRGRHLVTPDGEF